jgi:hypothetical protein
MFHAVGGCIMDVGSVGITDDDVLICFSVDIAAHDNP